MHSSAQVGCQGKREVPAMRGLTADGKPYFTAETQSSQSSGYFFDQELFTPRPLRLCGNGVFGQYI